MFKLLNNKLIMTFLTVGTVGSISTKALPIFYDENTIIRDSQDSNIKEVIEESKNEHQEANYKEIETSSDTSEESSTNPPRSNTNDKKKQEVSNSNKEIIVQKEVVASQSEKIDNNDLNKQETSNELNNADKNKQDANISNSEDTNNKINTEVESTINENPEVKIPTIHYDRTTSIYADDNVTLLRVEYYVNNKLTYYSVVEQFNEATKSYVEKIYLCDLKTNIDPLIRTDVYEFGNLIKSY